MTTSGVTHDVDDVANVPIDDRSPDPTTYILSHEGAAYCDRTLDYIAPDQVARYGAATFPAANRRSSSGSFISDEFRRLAGHECDTIQDPCSSGTSRLPLPARKKRC
ncbi:hypothetical protein PG993_003626 [Apiospora rasikravindrae]|uniref:Uncharacterized protein n=1 Tax=Apiospora rasikravindrae TaxID=990691 RepID=A0ABR1U023_9PEZI